MRRLGISGEAMSESTDDQEVRDVAWLAAPPPPPNFSISLFSLCSGGGEGCFSFSYKKTHKKGGGVFFFFSLSRGGGTGPGARPPGRGGEDRGGGCEKCNGKTAVKELRNYNVSSINLLLRRGCRCAGPRQATTIARLGKGFSTVPIESPQRVVETPPSHLAP